MASGDDSEITIPKTLYVSHERKLTKLTCEGFCNQFVNDISDLDCDCPFCFLVIRNATQISACGHSFCATCWSDWVGSHGDTSSIRCPVDNEFVDLTQVFVDRKQDRLIGNLRVYCDNKDFGCTVTPELRYVQAHMDKCEYQTVPCERKCGQVVMLRCLHDHMDNECPRRSVDCPKCGKCVDANYLLSHEDTCPMTPLTCQYCHTEDIARYQLTAHQETDCPKFPTLCSFALIGCSDKVERDALEAHHEAKSREHLRLLNAAQLYHTTGVTAESTDNLYELPTTLWGRVCEDGTNVPWTELPGSQESSGALAKAIQEASIWEKFEQLEKWKENVEKELRVLRNEKGRLFKKKSATAGRDVKEVVEGKRNECPCWWSVKLTKDMEYTESPSFYTTDGYRMVFQARWLYGFEVAISTQKGEDDDKLVWPWDGDEVLTVADAATGVGLGGCDVQYDGKLRDGGFNGDTGRFLMYKDLTPDMDNKAIKLTIKKKVNY